MKKPTVKTVLLEILTIIQYQNNKEKFAEEFEMLNRLDAIAEIIDRYPPHIQKKIKQVRKPDELERIVPRIDYQLAYQKVSQKALEAFILSIAPMTSSEQKEKIAQRVLQF